MKRVEIALRSTTAEMEKLLARKERAESKLVKALDKVEKLNCKWTSEEHRQFLDTAESVDGWMTNKAEIKLNGAWWDWKRAESALEEVTEAIEKATARLDKAQQAVDEYHEELQKIADEKTREALWQEEFEEEQKEWAKDGIRLEHRYSGYTPKGDHFFIFRNGGVTERSLHCFTLRIAGETIFTSGEFWRCYSVIKRR